MEIISISDIISIVGLLAGGGGIGFFFTWRYARRKEAAEAEQAETSAAKEVQDVYQQLIADVKADRQEQREYIDELKQDRQHLREERDELRQRIDKTDETVRNLQRVVARNSRLVESMRPFLCAKLECKLRQRVTISGGEVIETESIQEGGEDESKSDIDNETETL